MSQAFSVTFLFLYISFPFMRKNLNLQSIIGLQRRALATFVQSLTDIL